jgi:hypothetical protein
LKNILLGNPSFIDFWSCHLRASSLASEVHALDQIYAELIDTLPFTIEYLQGNKMPADGLSRLGQMVSDLSLLNLKNISATESEWRLNATSDQIYSMEKDDKYVKTLVCYLKFEKLLDSSTLRAFVLKLAN